MIEKRVSKKVRITAFALICIFALCAQECDTSWVDDVAGALIGTGLGLLGVDNENIQIAGLGAIAGGFIIDAVRQDAADYNPGIKNNYINIGIQARNDIIENRNKQNERQEKIAEIRTENERYNQEMIERFEAYEGTLPTGTSTVTGINEGRNIGNPQVNNLAANNGIVIPASPRRDNPGGRSQGTGAQRAEGNVTSRPQQTTRDGQSANPNAANNTESRKDGAPGSLSYTEPHDTGAGQQQQVITTQPTYGSTIARAGITPQQTPQMLAKTIADFTPQRQRANPISTPAPMPSQNQDINTDADGNHDNSPGKIYYFSILTGIFRTDDGSFEERCESGLIDLDSNYNYANKIEYIGKKNLGPIPPGTYEVIDVRQILHGVGHSNVIVLNRINGDARGRDNDFMIHGYRNDYLQKRIGRNGSNGCILMTPGNREKIAANFNTYGRGIIYVSE